MKQIKNPEYTKWCRNLRGWAMSNGYYWEERIDDRCCRLHCFSTNSLIAMAENDDKIRNWLMLNLMPAKIIDDPEYIAMQNTIKNLKNRCDELEHGKNIDISKLLREWHEHHDALSIDDVGYIVDRLLFHMRYHDELNIWWSVAKEDEHFYTDKGLEVPFHFIGDDADCEMCNLGVYIYKFKVSRNMTREQRYYKCLEADIERRLKEKEAKNA